MITAEKIAEFKSQLAAKKTAYDQAVGSVESLKQQLLEIDEIKTGVAGGLKFAEAVKTHLGNLRTNAERLKKESEKALAKFEEQYADLLVD